MKQIEKEKLRLILEGQTDLPVEKVIKFVEKHPWNVDRGYF